MFILRSRMHRSILAVSLFSASTILAACGSSEPKVPPKDIVPTTITATSTDTLRGAVATQLAAPVTVTVKNKAGDPIDSAIVTFAVGSGGGTVGSASVRTDVNGQASTTWTLGNTVGVQSVTATVGTLPAVSFFAVATAQTASAIAKAAGDAQTAAAGANVPIAPSVKVTDKFGNPVSGVLTTFSVASGGGSVTAASVNTDANGVATVGSWRLGTTAGPNTLTATASGVTPATFTATGVAGAVTQVKITNTAPTLSIGQTFTLTAQALDANNNRVTAATIAFTSDNPAVATVGSSTGTVTAVAAGTATITASAGGINATQVISVIGNPGSNVVATLAMSSRIADVVTAGTTAYAALSSNNTVAAVDLTSNVLAWSLTLTGQVVDVAANSANTLVAAVAAGGATSQFYLINPATHLATDSIPLAAPPVRMVMTSNGTRAFVDENSFQLEIIDIATKAVISQVPLPGTVTAMKMGPGDTLLYAGTALGSVYEIRVSSGAIVRQFNPSNTVADLAISPDGKTLFVADGTNFVFMVRLATGGLNGSVDFLQTVRGVGQPANASQLWVSQGNTVYAAPRDDNSFNPNLIAGRATVNGAAFTRIAFTRLGDIAVAIDDAGNNLVIIK
jgi:WD40 repeat protein